MSCASRISNDSAAVRCDVRNLPGVWVGIGHVFPRRDRVSFNLVSVIRLRVEVGLAGAVCVRRVHAAGGELGAHQLRIILPRVGRARSTRRRALSVGARAAIRRRTTRTLPTTGTRLTTGTGGARACRLAIERARGGPYGERLGFRGGIRTTERDAVADEQGRHSSAAADALGAPAPSTPFSSSHGGQWRGEARRITRKCCSPLWRKSISDGVARGRRRSRRPCDMRSLSCGGGWLVKACSCLRAFSQRTRSCAHG